MGMLQDAVNSFDKSKENAEAVSATLDLMVELTKTKAEVFKNQIEDSLNRGRILGKGDSTDSLYFPISSVKDSRIEYRCTTTDTPTDLIDTVGNAISGMISDHSAGNIVKGISTIIDSGLKTIMGLSEGMEQYSSTTSTFIDGSGIAVNIVRFDTIIWGRTVKASSIKDTIKTTLACVAYKSVVDVSKLNFDDFRSVYAPVMEASGETDVIVAIKKARDVYEALGGGSAITEKIAARSAPTEKVAARSTPTELLAIKPIIAKDLTFSSEIKKVSDNKF